MADSETKNPEADRAQPDSNLAAQERPVPSQAEGELETVEEDLAAQETKSSNGNQAG